ncbi:MAG TPA: transglycosylase SLT domain-containing protein, partial [Acetobacteraceae bacterium]|nr:transglycosylase SLT domain-containing protein [Acetobacteraceae bacterium]
RETERLQNDVLLGAILADRYLRNTPSAAELSAWLTAFGDQPEAPAIRGLLEMMAPSGAPAPGPEAPGRGTRRPPTDARRLFVENRDSDAIATGLAPHAGAEAQFVGGLAAVRLTEPDAASALFQAAYRAAERHTAGGAALRAASAFWEARVAQHAEDRGSFAVWMRRAALEGDTFYALIARRALGPAMACIAGETIGNADVEALLATAQGRRAFALLQVGERRLAEAELRALWVDTAQDGLFDRSIALAARAVGFTPLVSEIEQNPIARPPNDAALVRLRPAQGFVVDPPLVYGLVRHESNFQPTAVSPTGARGLMQLMPQTAHAVGGAEADQLHDPAVNLAIGQKYLLSLAQDEAIEGDLIRVLAGYGQGQGGLRRWVDQVRDGGDPLMFIEAIPNGPTRVFIQGALVSSWHYAAQLHVPAASLDSLAAGRYPHLLRAGEAKGAAGQACARVVGSR